MTHENEPREVNEMLADVAADKRAALEAEFRAAAKRLAHRALESSKFRELWDDANAIFDKAARLELPSDGR